MSVSSDEQKGPGMKDEEAREAIRNLARVVDKMRMGCPIDQNAVSAAVARLKADETPYGFCPLCGQPGVSRQRRPNGDDTCAVGHTYFSSSALNAEQGAERRKRTP